MLWLKLLKAGPWMPWLPVAALVGLIAWATSSLHTDFGSRQLHLRAALLVAALGLSFVFDDPASRTTDPAPSPLRKRRSLRTLLGIIPWMILVAVILRVAAKGMEPVLILSEQVQNPLPVGRLLLEATTMAAWGLAIASVIARRWDDEPGRFASPALLAVYATSWVVPDQWKPWASPADPRWDTALPWWWLALGLGVAVSILFSWDSRPGWRRTRNRLRREAPHDAAGPDVHPFTATRGK